MFTVLCLVNILYLWRERQRSSVLMLWTRTYSQNGIVVLLFTGVCCDLSKGAVSIQGLWYTEIWYNRESLYIDFYGCVASGNIFVSPGDPFFLNLSMVFSRRVRVWALSLTTRNDTHAPITHPFLGRIFCWPCWLLTLSQGKMIETFYENSHCTACICFGGLVTIFVSASGPNTPCDVTCRPSFDAV